MASTKAPLFGLDASGTLAKSIVFSKWRGRTYVRRHAIPANPKSGTQVGMRSVFKFLTQAYGSLSDTIKSNWKDEGSADNITGLNAQVRDGQRLARRNLGWRQDPQATAGTTPAAPTIDSVTAQPKALKVAWTSDSIDPGDYCYALYMDTSTGFTPSIANLVDVGDVATQTTTITGLTTGTTYYFKIRELNTDGELGTLSTESSGTPT